MLRTLLSRKWYFSAVEPRTLVAHNYTLEVWVSGPIDPGSGMVINLRHLDGLLEKLVTPYSGKAVELEYSKLAQVLFAELSKSLAQFNGLSLDRLQLFRGPDLGIEVEPET